MTLRRSPSYPRFVVTSDGEVIGPSGRKLRHFPDKDGYRRVNIYLGNNSWKQVAVHFLVCEAFHGARPDGAQVAHRDGDSANNRADNLRWATQRDNESDKVTHGTGAWCERHGMHKLTGKQVREIRTRRATGELLRTLAAEFGVSMTQVSAIANGKSWAALK